MSAFPPNLASHPNLLQFLTRAWRARCCPVSPPCVTAHRRSATPTSQAHHPVKGLVLQSRRGGVRELGVTVSQIQGLLSHRDVNERWPGGRLSNTGKGYIFKNLVFTLNSHASSGAPRRGPWNEARTAKARARSVGTLRLRWNSPSPPAALSCGLTLPPRSRWAQPG